MHRIPRIRMRSCPDGVLAMSFRAKSERNFVAAPQSHVRNATFRDHITLTWCRHEWIFWRQILCGLMRMTTKFVARPMVPATGLHGPDAVFHGLTQLSVLSSEFGGEQIFQEFQAFRGRRLTTRCQSITDTRDQGVQQVVLLL